MRPSFSTKAKARAHYLYQRRELSQKVWDEKSRRILSHLTATGLYQSFDVLLCYVSAKDGEVDTHALIDDALSRDKIVFVPVVLDHGAGKMGWAPIEDRKELIRGSFGLYEPHNPPRIFASPPSTSLCIIPGIAFSKSGHRLGYGGGYYDRFLRDYKGFRVGLAFSFQENASFPQDAHDEALHYLVTEEGMTAFEGVDPLSYMF